MFSEISPVRELEDKFNAVRNEKFWISSDSDPVNWLPEASKLSNVVADLDKVFRKSIIDEEELTDEEYGCMTCERSHPTKLKTDRFWRPIITFTQLFALAREVPSIVRNSKEDREDNQSKFSTLQLPRESRSRTSKLVRFPNSLGMVP
ncbi:hypothetical protein Tco_1199365 [Tanacetum coccineum]